LVSSSPTSAIVTTPSGNRAVTLQRAAELLDVAAQVAHVHVRAALELLERRLANRELRRQLLQRHRPVLAQLVQRERSLERVDVVGDPRFARRR
jgi:hypothetical protein